MNKAGTRVYVWVGVCVGGRMNLLVHKEKCYCALQAIFFHLLTFTERQHFIEAPSNFLSGGQDFKPDLCWLQIVFTAFFFFSKLLLQQQSI